MLVREATIEDIDGLVAVLVAVAEEGRWIGTEAPVDVEQRADRLRARLAGGDVLLVLEDDRRHVGNGDLHATHAAGVVGLGMAIVADARGRGGGRVLIEALIARARELGCHKVELEVWPDNERAIALYAKHGFEVEGLRRDHYRRRDGSLRSSLIMALLL
ncbi:MAG: [ribosomal protein S18]-alanine N-acetyltransferase [bacterium]|jgi:RimJ/RimL family protein N-acetyltransferase